jgi:hypothetical protein
MSDIERDMQKVSLMATKGKKAAQHQARMELAEDEVPKLADALELIR